MSSSYFVTYGTDRLTFGGSGSVAWEALLDTAMFFPVGTYITSIVSSFNPNGTYPGTWTKTDTYGRCTICGSSNIGATGGEEKHTLTIAEMPQHTHTTNRVTYANYGNDTQTQNWNVYRSNQGNLDKIYNGTASMIQANNTAQGHNNVQPSMIVYRWHRTV